jgi:membrane peptidoglycan carboxypeptidase
VAGKTGTSQAWRDAWFDGYVPQLATIVWVGNPVPVRDGYGNWTIESMTPSNGYPFRVVGATYPARIWYADMQPSVAPSRTVTFRDPPQTLFHEPKELKDAGEIDIGSGLAAIIDLRRQGFEVIVHTECPSEAVGRGIHTWKAERHGKVTEVWRSRAVCR